MASKFVKQGLDMMKKTILRGHIIAQGPTLVDLTTEIMEGILLRRSINYCHKYEYQYVWTFLANSDEKKEVQSFSYAMEIPKN